MTKPEEKTHPLIIRHYWGPGDHPHTQQDGDDWAHVFKRCYARWLESPTWTASVITPDIGLWNAVMASAGAAPGAATVPCAGQSWTKEGA